MDQYYFEEGYLVAGYLTIVKEATAGLTPYFVDGYLPAGYFDLEGNAYGGIFSLSALLTKAGEPVYAIGTWSSIVSTSITVNVIRGGAAAINVAFTQTSTISHIEGADLFAFSNAQLTAAVRRIRNNNISASAAFSVATDATRTRNTSSDDSAFFSFTANTVRSRSFASSQSAAFSLAATIDNRVRNQSSALASQFAFTATISHIEGADLRAFTNASLSATATRTKQFASSLASASSVSANVTRNPGIIKNLSSAFTQTAQARVSTKGGVANLSSSFSIYTSLKLGSVRPFNLVGRNTQASLNSSFKKSGTYSLRLVTGDSTVITAIDDLTNAYGRSEFEIQTGENFIFETWIYKPGNTAPASREPVIAGVGAAGNYQGTLDYPNMANYTASNNVWMLGVDNTGYLKAWYTQSNGLRSSVGSTTLLPSDSWSHIAFRRNNGTTLQILINNSVVGSATYSGSLKPSTNSQANKKFFLANTFNSSTSSHIYFDETSYRVGSGTIAGYSAQPIVGDPASQQLLFHFESSSDGTDYRTFFDDTGFVTEFNAGLESFTGLGFNGGLRLLTSASLSSSSTVTADVTKIRFIEFAAYLSSNFTESVTATRIKQISSSQNTAFTQITDVRRTRNITSNQSSAFTQSTGAVKTASIASALNSQATFTATISHIEGADLRAFTNGTLSAIGVVTRNAASTQASAFTQTANTNLSRIRSASSAVNGAFTQSTAVIKTAVASSTISSQATTSTLGQRIRFGLVTASAASSLSATVQRVKVALASLTSAFRTEQYYVDQDYFDSNYFGLVGIASSKTVSANIALIGFASELVLGTKRAIADPLYLDLFTDLTVNTRVVYSPSKALQAVATTTITARKSAVANSSLASAFTQTATPNNRTRSQTSNLASAFSLTAAVNEYQGLAVIMSTAFTQTANNTRTRAFASALSSAASLTVSAKVTRTTSSSLASASTFTATISHIEGADLVANSFATLTVSAFVGKIAQATLSSQFTQTATAKRTRGIVSNQASAFTQTATPNNRTRNQSATLSTAFAFTATISHIEGADLVAFSSSTVTTSATKTVRTGLTATSAANFTASAVKFRAFNANLAASTSLSANATKLVLSAATLQARAVIQANATRIKQFSITISSALTFVTTVREIDARSLTQFVYTIPAENFTWIVPDEVPVYNEILYVIPNENWAYTIPQETREIVLEQETRIYNIRSS